MLLPSSKRDGFNQSTVSNAERLLIASRELELGTLNVVVHDLVRSRTTTFPNDAALWKKSLNSILDHDDALADDDSGQVLKFVSPRRASEAATWSI